MITLENKFRGKFGRFASKQNMKQFGGGIKDVYTQIRPKATKSKARKAGRWAGKIGAGVVGGVAGYYIGKKVAKRNNERYVQDNVMRIMRNRL